jgi:hypothetical protein
MEDEPFTDPDKSMVSALLKLEHDDTDYCYAYESH